MFISKKEKEKIYKHIQFLKDLIEYLSERVFQLEGKKLSQEIKDFPPPKKRGRPVGSKNKEK
jgi:hypothetical protein